MNILEIGRRAVSIDSSISHGTKDVVEFLGSVATSLGLHVESWTEMHAGVENALIWITPQNATADKDLLLVSHLDTEDPGEYIKWTKTGANPFQASIDGENIFGLGTADAKFDFIAKMAALAKLNGHTFSKIRPVLAGTFGAESSQGITRLLRRKKFKAVGALVGRPTKLMLANRGPGYAMIEISIPFSGREREYRENHDVTENSHSQSKVFSSGNKHGLEPGFYDNPIVKMLEYVRNLPDGFALMSVDGGTSAETSPDMAFLELDLVDSFDDSILPKLKSLYEILRKFSGEFQSVRADGFEPAHSTFNIGQIRTFGEMVTLSGSCRIVPTVTKEIYDGWLSQLRDDCEKMGARFQIIDYKAPFVGSSEGPLSVACRTAGQALGLSQERPATLTASEASFFQRIKCEAYVFGAGQSVGNTQIDNEHINMDDLGRAQAFYSQVIERFCL